jgi:hypothetical protein
MNELIEMKAMEKEAGRVAGWFLYWNYPSGGKPRLKMEDVYGYASKELVRHLSRQSGREFFEDVLNEVKKRYRIDFVWRVEALPDGRGWSFYLGQVKVDKKLKVYPFNLNVLRDREIEFVNVPKKLTSKIMKVVEELKDTDSASYVMTNLIRYLVDELYALRMRKDGGLYFVQSRFKERLDDLTFYMKKLGFIVYRIPVLDEEGTRDAIWEILREEVSRIDDEVKRYVKELEDGARFNSKGFETRYEVVKKVKEKLQSYADLGTAIMESLKNVIDDLESKLVEVRLKYDV